MLGVNCATIGWPAVNARVSLPLPPRHNVMAHDSRLTAALRAVPRSRHCNVVGTAVATQACSTPAARHNVMAARPRSVLGVHGYRPERLRVTVAPAHAPPIVVRSTRAPPARPRGRRAACRVAPPTPDGAFRHSRSRASTERSPLDLAHGAHGAHGLVSRPTRSTRSPRQRGHCDGAVAGS